METIKNLTAYTATAETYEWQTCWKRSEFSGESDYWTFLWSEPCGWIFVRFQMRIFRTLRFLAVCLMVSLQTKKVFCDCGGRIKAKTRNGETAYSTVVVYSTDGSQEGRHYEHRQDNSFCRNIRIHKLNLDAAIEIVRRGFSMGTVSWQILTIHQWSITTTMIALSRSI